MGACGPGAGPGGGHGQAALEGGEFILAAGKPLASFTHGNGVVRLLCSEHYLSCCVENGPKMSKRAVRGTE